MVIMMKDREDLIVAPKGGAIIVGIELEQFPKPTNNEGWDKTRIAPKWGMELGALERISKARKGIEIVYKRSRRNYIPAEETQHNGALIVIDDRNGTLSNKFNISKKDKIERMESEVNRYRNIVSDLQSLIEREDLPKSLNEKLQDLEAIAKRRKSINQPEVKEVREREKSG